MTPDPGLPPVVRAKLTQPRALPSRLRPATLDLACRGLEGRLTLVCAPGGYGKTTVALEALNKTGVRSAWYRIDELDRDPVVFLASITESVALAVPGFGDRIRDRLRSATEGHLSTAELAAVFVSDLAEHLTGPLHLVIDDYHEAIGSPGLNATLEYLLTAAPELLHFVILSRYEPAFAVSKMRLAGDVTRLGVEQLRLTGRETRLLVKDRGDIVLDEASSERLAHLTQGWPASIALAGMALHWLDFPSIEAAVSDPRLKRDVYSYLTEQVYLRESAATQAFLLDTCCLEYVSPELANDVAARQDGHAQLEHLTANQVFTDRGDDDNACRYHPLLRDFLRQRCLQERGAAAYHALQVKSAQAMERAGDLPSAIAIYLAANEGEEALNVIGRADFWTLEDIRSDTLQTWLSRLPASLRMHPWAMVLQAHLLMRSGKYEESVRWADDALQRFVETADRAGRYQALCVKECALFWKGDNQGARAASQEALEVADRDSERIHALLSLAAACEGGCGWEEAMKSLDLAASLGRQSSEREELRLRAHRATIPYLTGHFREAEERFREVNLDEKEGSSLGLRATVMNCRGLTLLALGMYDAADAEYRLAMDLVEVHGYPFYSAMIASCWSQVRLAKGDTEHAAALTNFATSSGLLSEDAHCLAYAHSHKGTLLRRTGRLEEAAASYQQALDVAREGRALHAQLNAAANLMFTQVSQDHSRCCTTLEEIRDQAAYAGMRFIASKSSFFLAAAKHRAGRRKEGVEELSAWIADAVSLGHLNFLSQELALLPDATLEVLDTEVSDGLRFAVIQAIVLSPASVSLIMRLLDEKPHLGPLALQASGALAPEERDRLLRRAARHRNSAVRRMAGAVQRDPLRVKGQTLDGLTPRESEVLALLADGMANDRIAEVLFLSPSTVKTHVNRIFVKLGVTTRIQAANTYRETTSPRPKGESD